MAELNARMASLDGILSAPGAFLSADAPGHQALKDREEAKARLDELELEWLELEEKRDQA